jgi:hypothetical protein
MDHEKDGPIKAKAQASGTKQMVVAFFDQQKMNVLQLCASGHDSHCCPHCHDPDFGPCIIFSLLKGERTPG